MSDDAIDRELGRSIIELKRPTFLYRFDYKATAFGISFDYILAQSIFSHAGRDVVSSGRSDRVLPGTSFRTWSTLSFTERLLREDTTR